MCTWIILIIVDEYKRYKVVSIGRCVKNSHEQGGLACQNIISILHIGCFRWAFAVGKNSTSEVEGFFCC